MKLHKLFMPSFLVFASLLCVGSVFAQESSDVKKSVTVRHRPVEQAGDSLLIDFTVDFNDFRMNTLRQLVLTPFIKSEYRNKVLPPLVVNGKKRGVLYRRTLALNKDVLDPCKVINLKKKSSVLNESVTYRCLVPAEGWMKSASLILEQNLCGCGGEEEMLSTDVLAKNILSITPPSDINFDFSGLFVNFIEPPRVSVKNLTEADEAYIMFKVADDKIIPGLYNNALELAKIDRSFNYIREEPTARITNLRVLAYASPEGSSATNLKLSGRRAGALVEKLKDTQFLNSVSVYSEGRGEDWETLVQLIKKDSTLSEEDKNALCYIIDSTPDADQRDKSILKYKNGQPYRYMLDQLYPKLRRCDYYIEFSVPEFTLEKSREVLLQRPGMLSLSEFFMLANSYPRESQEFAKLFEIAVRIFPDDPVARLNVAAAELKNGNIAAAESRLRFLKDDPRAWNNMGVVLMHRKKLDEAEQYLLKAKDAGYEEASQNLVLLPELREELARYEEAKAKYDSMNSK